MNNEEKYKNLERAHQWIANCDNKVSYLLTLQGIILTIIFTSNYATCIFRTLSYKFRYEGWYSILKFCEGIALYTFIILVFCSLYNTYMTLTARLDPKEFAEEGMTTNSVLFFESIANRRFRKFLEDQETSYQADSHKNDIDSQVFISSKICQLKFKHYNLTLKYCARGFVIGVLYIILVFINSAS